MPQRRLVLGERLITSYHPERNTTMLQTRLQALESLFLDLHKNYVTLKAENERLTRQIQTMQGRQPALRRMQAHITEHTVPEPPDVLAEVVQLQKAQGRRA